MTGPDRFKTDDLAGRQLVDVAAPYLPQLALYAGALRRATGSQPTTGLLFLRTGEVYEPAADDLEMSLATTRMRVDQGLLVDEAAPEEALPS